jgi:predicted anti-sigma-YlaC factor YlaD
MAHTDPPTITCTDVGELLSAREDAETTSAENATVDHHLSGCAECSTLAAHIGDLSRQLRFRPADPIPNLVRAISERTRPAVLGRGGWLRPAMAWVAVVLFAQNVVALVDGRLDGADDHLARHVGAFGVALAIGFAYVAWKPHRSHGLLPFAAALIVTISISALADIIDGGRTVLAESAHITEIVGLALLWMIAGSPGWTRWTDWAGRHGHVHG